MGYYGQSYGSYQTTSKLTTTFGLINQFESEFKMSLTLLSGTFILFLL